jgi:hypothetical protein
VQRLIAPYLKCISGHFIKGGFLCAPIGPPKNDARAIKSSIITTHFHFIAKAESIRHRPSHPTMAPSKNKRQKTENGNSKDSDELWELDEETLNSGAVG